MKSVTENPHVKTNWSTKQIFIAEKLLMIRFDEVTLSNSVTAEHLKSGSYINNYSNIVKYGNVGTGKTHLSIALGMEACNSRYSVRSFRTAALVNLLSEMKAKDTLSLFVKKLLKSDLITFDEWGYIPIDRTGGELLFEVISECYERRSIIINTNLEFSKWVNVFYDEQMTAAITRITMPLLLKQVRVRYPQANIKILVATGFHRTTTPDELPSIFCDQVFKNEDIIVHDAFDKTNMVFKYILPSGGELWINNLVNWVDLIVAEGFIEPHFFVGFNFHKHLLICQCISLCMSKKTKNQKARNA